MKLMIAVPSQYHSRKIFNETLRWLPRAGFRYRVFVPDHQVRSYRRRIKNANYLGYLDIQEGNIVEVPLDQSEEMDGYIKTYAKEHGFELVLLLRDNISTFKYDGKLLEDDELIIKFHSIILKARTDIESKYRGGEIILMELPL